MTDKTEIMISKTTQRIAHFRFFAKEKDVLPLLWFCNIEQALTVGMTTGACASFAAFAMLLGHMKDIKASNRLSRLALKSLEEFGDDKATTMLHLIYYYMSHHWSFPLQKSIDPLSHAYTIGMKSGAVQTALMCGVSSCANYFASGLDLEFLEHNLRKYLGIMESYNLQLVTDLTYPFYQMILILTGSDKN